LLDKDHFTRPPGEDGAGDGAEDTFHPVVRGVQKSVGWGQDFGCKQENQESPGKPREDGQHQYDNQTDASPVDEDIACTTEPGQEAGESAEVELPRPLVSMEVAVVDMQAWCKWRWVDRPTKARRDRTKPKAKQPRKNSSQLI